MAKVVGGHNFVVFLSTGLGAYTTDARIKQKCVDFDSISGGGEGPNAVQATEDTGELTYRRRTQLA